MLKPAHKSEIHRQLSMNPSMATNKLVTALCDRFPSTTHKTKSGRRAIKGVSWDNVYAYQMAILPEITANADTVLTPTHIEVQALGSYPEFSINDSHDLTTLMNVVQAGKAIADEKISEFTEKLAEAQGDVVIYRKQLRQAEKLMRIVKEIESVSKQA